MARVKDVATTLLTVLCVTTALSIAIPRSSSQSTSEFNPWADVNSDGKVDILDLATAAKSFGLTGNPIDKTVLGHLQTDASTCGLLLSPPIGAMTPDGGLTSQAVLFSLDLDQNEPGNQQSIWVLTGATIKVTGELQVTARPGEINQAFFIYSWTPTWPAPEDYYAPVWEGIPGPYPGSGRIQFTFDVTVPNTPGYNYLHFCFEAMYNMPDAVNQFEHPLWIPHAIIMVRGY